MSPQNRLLIFCFITTLGSSLSCIASFLSVEIYFQSITLLGFALGIRTLASAGFSYISNNVLHKLGLRGSFLASQLFGIASLTILFIGFHSHNMILMLIGILLTGIPATFVSILLSIALRSVAENDDQFRKYSGRRELVINTALLISSIAAPLMLYAFNLGTVLFIDGASYFIGFILLINLHMKSHSPEQDQNESFLSLRHVLITSKDAMLFMVKTGSALSLSGILPLLASSSHIVFTEHMPSLVRQWLWVVEDITALSASFFYLMLITFKHKKWFEPFLMFNAIWFFIPLVFLNDYSVIAIIIIVFLLIGFSFQKFRDDLIVSAKNNAQLVKAYSALSQLQRNFIFFLSPIILSELLTHASAYVCIAIICLVQMIFCFLLIRIKSTVQPL